MQKVIDPESSSFVLSVEDQVALAQREIELSRKSLGVLDLIARGMTSHKG